MVNFKRTDSADNDYLELVKLLDAELKVRDGDDHAFFAQYNKSDDIKNVIVCYSDNHPAGCGAFKFYSTGIVEIKRMYVKESLRGKGLASGILVRLEDWAKESGFSECILETGKKQPEAIALYIKSGYNRIPNYGQYASVASSVCMKKSL